MTFVCIQASLSSSDTCVLFNRLTAPLRFTALLNPADTSGDPDLLEPADRTAPFETLMFSVQLDGASGPASQGSSAEQALRVDVSAHVPHDAQQASKVRLSPNRSNRFAMLVGTRAHMVFLTNLRSRAAELFD